MKKVIICLVIFTLCGCTNNNSYKTISVSEAYQNMNNSDIVVVDVRSYNEFKSGHIVDAINIPLDTINENLDIAKDEIIYVYCASGKRSKLAAEALINLGYQNVYDLGGINNWIYEIEK